MIVITAVIMLVHFAYIDKAWRHSVYIHQYSQDSINRRLYYSGIGDEKYACKKHQKENDYSRF